jgi:Rad3-related DNA helicase
MAQPDPSSPALADRAHRLAERAREAAGADDPQLLERLEIALDEVGDAAREGLQDRFRPRFESLARRIEEGQELDEADRGMLRLLFTGAGTVYLREEDDVGAWRDEIRRLADRIDEAATGLDSGADAGPYLRLQAAITEARRVAPDLRYFLEEGRRVERFLSSTERLTPEDRPYLARLIRDLLASPNR